jgi:hypothetical protein
VQIGLGLLLALAGCVPPVLLTTFRLGCLVGGPLPALNGFVDLPRKRALHAQLRRLSEQGEELPAAVIEAKQSGGRSVRLLHDRGIEDIHLRQATLREASRRFAQAGESLA